MCDTKYCIVDGICDKPEELQFLKLLAEVANDFDFSILDDSEENELDDEQEDSRYMPI